MKISSKEVESEIKRLLDDPDVKLAKLESRVFNKRRQYMYQLRSMAKRGKELREKGVTAESLYAIEEQLIDMKGAAK